MKSIDPNTSSNRSLHHFLIGAVSPRPIALVSTIDKDGKLNLAPYSFFNVFSSKPPILVFSPSRRGRDNTTKDTLDNVLAVEEVVVNVVPHDLVWQMSITSMEYETEISEFDKAGLTPIPSELVSPSRVKESPVHFECKVQQIIPMGDKPGAGNLVICEVLLIHYDDSIMDENNFVDPHKIDLMGRMGKSYYVRSSGEAIHEITRKDRKVGIGFEQLPQKILSSHILTANNLGQLASIARVPDTEEVLELKNDPKVDKALHSDEPENNLHKLAQRYLEESNTEHAAKIVWLCEYI
ncbi:MAG: flavin reductase family protein [Bacteroidota bacterium]